MNHFPAFLLTVVTLLASCADKDRDDVVAPTPVPVNEEEVITTMVLTFADINTFVEYEMRFEDPDGEGGNDPVITSDDIPGGFTYVVNLSLLNESSVPVGNITAEIEDENEEHQFFFEVVGADLDMDYADEDENGHPVGIHNIATAGAAGTGTLKVTLRHGPDKGAAGVAAGDITNAGGETDIEVTFPVVII